MKEMVFGKSVLMNSLESNREIYKIYLVDYLEKKETTIIEEANKRNIELEILPKGLMDKMFKGNHQGLAAEVKAYDYVTVEEALDGIENPVVLILDNLEDPHNLGAILRTADATNVDLVIIPKNRSVSLNATVAKVSTGAIEYVKVAQVSNINQTIEKLKKRGMWIYATCMDAPKNYFEEDFRGPVGIVIGNEGKGISPLVLKNSDFKIKIPMSGHVDSLNASVSASLLMYEVYNQRH